MEGVWKWLIGAVVAATAAGGGWIWLATDPNAPAEESTVEDTQEDGSPWTGDLIRDKLDPTKQ